MGQGRGEEREKRMSHSPSSSATALAKWKRNEAISENVIGKCYRKKTSIDRVDR